MPTSVRELACEISRRPSSLLLGAGASIPSGALSGPDLSDYLARHFDSPELVGAGLGLSTVSEVLEIKHGRRPVVDAIAMKVKSLSPLGGLAALPHFDWRCIYSTNYDLLVEKAYASVGKELAVIRSDYDYPTIDQAEGTLLFKIHGCLTQDRSLGDRASLVLTDTDYIEPSKISR